ncbi:MAG: undecaprenyl/decaprenyl-phosphate alpha-N-acetylglucosaminyl 1-phosphate transferase [Tidjanibacter sp.]|nr:undecaprenyl/decaprenyl-phosphate alpha-N-acetylglucosaminyl 1-phosphate transferase [Tidjanibacter sp.]
MLILNVFLPALVALVASAWFHPHILQIAKEKNIVDNPDARKLQRVPVPIMGGVAVVFGLLAGVMCFTLMSEFDDLLPVFTSVTVMMLVGMVDDIRGLSPRIRFFVEILLVVFLIFSTGNQINNFHGLWGINILSPWISVPLTIFACVGIINAINLIDGVDGYSSGYCIMASVFFGYAFYKLYDVNMVALSAVIIAALIPFFLCNVFCKHSKMFIGDAGTLSMGILMSTFVANMLTVTTDRGVVDANFGLIPFTLAVMCVPIFDTLRVMSIRILRGKSPFHPDKTHLHHLFIDLGFSHIGTTFSILSMNFLVVLIWYAAYEWLECSINMQLYIVIFCGLLITFIFYGLMRRHIASGTKFYVWMTKLGAKTHVEKYPLWVKIQMWIDARMVVSGRRGKHN